MSDIEKSSDAVDPDCELVRQAKQGDYTAFESLVARHERQVYALGLRIAGQAHDADEVVQQTFLSVVEHLADFREDAKFSTWLLRIATNHALLLLRKRARRQERPLNATGESDEGYGDLPHPQFIAQWRERPEEMATRRETRQLLNDALTELDEKYRLVFVLRDIEGLSTAEAAAALGISEANVKVRLLRARLMLREKLTRFFGDEATQVKPHDHH